MVCYTKKQKYKYYECKNRECKIDLPYGMRTLRENKIIQCIDKSFSSFKLDKSLYQFAYDAILSAHKDTTKRSRLSKNGVKTKIRNLREKHENLLDAMLEGYIEKSEYKKKSEKIHRSIKKMEKQIEKIENTTNAELHKVFIKFKALMSVFCGGYSELNFEHKAALNDLFIDEIRRSSNSVKVLYNSAFSLFIDCFSSKDPSRSSNFKKPVVELNNGDLREGSVSGGTDETRTRNLCRDRAAL